MTIPKHVLLAALTLVGVTAVVSVAQFPKKPVSDTGTLEKMIVANGTVAMNLDLSRLDGSAAETVRFQAVADSFFPVVVFNNEVRGVQLGSIHLIPLNSVALPEVLSAAMNHLVIEKTASHEAFDLVVRDSKSGFVFFNIEGNIYNYDAATRALDIKGGRLLVSEEFAKELGRPSDAGSVIGEISIAAALRAIETRKVVNGEEQSGSLPPGAGMGDAVEGFVPGPDVIVGDLPSMQQFGTNGTRVGLAIGTTSCNAGNVQLNWFAMPNTDHPVIPQNLFRMSGGSTNSDRFEQIGQSWLKHAFTALQQNACGFGCSSSGTGTRLGVGCSDPYSASLNASQTGLGSRAWVNPFTGIYPATARDHSGHPHASADHQLIVEASDINPTSNVGATYYGEAQYVTPHEYVWCQSHPGECNMYNNVSYRRFNVTGSGTNFSFPTVGNTVREEPAIKAWTGATIKTIEPAPGADGRGFVAYKVSGPVGGVYHYEYAVYNQNLDRAIGAFTVPLGCGVTVSNVGFYAPRNHPGAAGDGTAGSLGYSNTAWAPTQTASALTWTTDTLAQNANANAIRWGTMYNFRFDSTQPPQSSMATVGFFKTGQPITVEIQSPTPVCTPLQAVSAVSRKTHGSAGTFDIALPFGDQPGVESRRNANGDHTIVFTFSNQVMSGKAAVTAGGGSVVGSPTVSGNTMTVALTGVPAAGRVTLTLSKVTDNFAQTMPDTDLTLKALLGDTDGNSSVSASDIGRTKSEASNAVTATNFRSDVTADGSINASDIGAVKSMAGATVP